MSHSGIEFRRGTRKLRLTKAEINETIDFPDDFEFKSSKQEKKFVKNFVDDVTRFGEKVAQTTRLIYDAATQKIATWIQKDDVIDGNLKKRSIFGQNLGELRTAIVQCNFTDIGRLIGDLTLKIYEDLDENREISHFLVTEGDSIHSIIDRIGNCKSGTFCLIIRQFESLRPKFLDSLVSLIYSNSLTRGVVPRVRLVVCVSTSPQFFEQTCSTETLALMDVEQFRFTKLDEIFSKVISTGIHALYLPPVPKPKSIEEDDPSRLTSLDCSPALFSGAFLKYLKNRFFACDFSISALIRAVQFAMLRKYLEDPLWRHADHGEELRKYDVVLRSFQMEFWEGDAVNLHIEVQSDSKFWDKVKETANFRERKQFLFESTSKRTLTDFLDRIHADLTGIDDDWCQKLDELVENLAEIGANSVPTTSNPVKTEKTPSKMSMSEFQQQRKAQMAAKQNNPVRSAKSAIFTHVMALYETVLVPYPPDWRNVIGGSHWVESGGVKTALDSSDEFDLEHTLLQNQNHLDTPISLAWRTLLAHRNFKSVPMQEWAEAFLKNTNLDPPTAKGAFFAAAGHLEHMGVIRGAADKKSTNVHVLYHPISFFSDL